MSSEQILIYRIMMMAAAIASGKNAWAVIPMGLENMTNVKYTPSITW